ncbi:MAG: HEAT repeat domain-containing protein [Spirochaetes bacterium]|nr:HEAT repeat domain-containing protein [Spirochaetota bacterium]
MKKSFQFIIIIFLIISSLNYIVFAQQQQQSGSNNDKYSTVAPEDLTLEELFLGLKNVPLDSLVPIVQAGDDHDLLLIVVQMLAANKSKEAIDLLIKILDIGVNNVKVENGVIVNNFWDVRVEAAYVLGELKAKDAVPKLIEILQKDNDPIVKAYIAMALGKIGDKTVVPVLINLLQIYKNEYKSSNAPLIYGIIVALGDLGDPQAYGVLLEVSQGNFPMYIRQIAIQSIKKIQTGGKS